MDNSNIRACRACLQDLSINGRKLSDPVKSFYWKPSVTYLDAFISCTGFLVDQLEPQDICDECASELLISFQFKQKCSKTQDELEKRKVKIEDVQVKVEVFADSILLPKIEEEISEDDYKEENDAITEAPDVEALSVNPSKADTLKTHRSWKCDLCGRKYKERRNLHQHYNLKHKQSKNHACPHCNQKQYLQFLNIHIKRCQRREKRNHCKKEKTDEKVVDKGLCPICGILMSHTHIRSHIEKNSNASAPEPFICEICGSKLSSKSGILMHMQIQHLKVMFKCRHCPEEFRTTQLRDSHLRIIHPAIKGLLKCDFCEYTSVYHASLRKHRTIHTGEKSHKCPVCQREFNIKRKLLDHLATHSDARPFACEICGATFKTRKNLNVHKKVHRERDYECPVCQRTFLTNQLMSQHVKGKHPDYQLPPPGTVISKSWRKKVAEQKLKVEAIRNGVDKKVVETIVVSEVPPIEQLTMFQRYN